MATRSKIVASIHDEPHLSRSDVGGRMRDLRDAPHVPRPQSNAIVDAEVDFPWRAQRLVVETDGHEHHGSPQRARARSRARGAP